MSSAHLTDVALRAFDGSSWRPLSGRPAECQAETRSQTKIRVSFGLMALPAPRLP